MSTEQEEEKKKKRPLMKSLLEEHLDVITEDSEHSEGSSSLRDKTSPPLPAPGPTEEIQVSPRRKSTKDIHVSPRRSSHHHVKSPKKSPSRSRRPKVSMISGEENEQNKTSRRNRISTLAPLDEHSSLGEDIEEEKAAKLSESGGEDSYYISTDEDEQELAFDGDCSVMMFDYDDEDDGEDDYEGHSSSRSVTSHSIAEDDDLTWRLDPAESLSDWTIKVMNKGTRQVECYNVHKNILGVGKRKCEYFASIFRQKGNKTNVTEVTMEDSAARVVPMVLDYIYSDDTAVKLSADTAPGLRYLAQFFGIRVLFEKVMAFIQKDLSLKTLISYYKASNELGDKKVLTIAARHCARNIHLIDTSHELLNAMDAPFFTKVLSMPGLEGAEKKMHISRLIAAYCVQHKNTLDGPHFQKLTTEEHLPQIDHMAALTLLGMEADLVVATSVTTLMSLSSLQKRCIKSLSMHWRDLTELSPERTAGICKKLPSFVVTELLLRSLDNAKKDCEFPTGDKPNNRRQESSRSLKRDGSQRVVKTKKSEDAKKKVEHEQAMKKVKEEYESKFAHLQELCYEKDKIIQQYYEEIGNFCRLPNSHDGKLTSSGRSSQPTVMPHIGKHAKEGYLLAGRKLSGAKYPIFYYKKEVQPDKEAAPTKK